MSSEKHEKLWSLLERDQINTKDSLEKAFAHHLEYTVGKHRYNTEIKDVYEALSYTVRDVIIDRLNETQGGYRVNNPKRVYYLSLEFLIGRTLSNALINTGLLDLMKGILEEFGYNLTEILDYEPDAGLGNGGLGRLAACFMDSLSTLNLPGYGYGIRYEYGIFNQQIENDMQIEKPDSWLTKSSNPWEIIRQDVVYPINFYGYVDTKIDPSGKIVSVWHATETVLAMAHDYSIPGYNTITVNNLRLWVAKSSEEFNFDYFNHGDYLKAVEDKQKTENISKVLYPNDTTEQGKILRLKQQYFMVSSSLQDIIVRYKRANKDFKKFSDEVAIQLNDTHPSIAIPELMRIFLDIEKMDWETAWSITTKVFAYTNHTVLPEALETWTVALFEYLLPRHLQIINEINHRFLEEVKRKNILTDQEISDVSIYFEGAEKRLRMANLAIIGSHSVNGVAALHSELLKETIFKAFFKLSPEKFNNKTNGITQRRFLINANPKLSKLISSKIGEGFATNLDLLKGIEQFSEDSAFQDEWNKIKNDNKLELAKIIKADTGYDVDIHSIFDVQIKRFHEYKRQLLNILHVISLFRKLHDNPSLSITPRTFIFSGKAAPGYYMAKLIIRLINSVARVINQDPRVKDFIKVIFLPNYRVSLAERIFPASDLSEQISTAGTEASGTGNMKFALNGALTIGTLDGANVEIMEEVGEDNIFIFGLKAHEVMEVKRNGYNPLSYIGQTPDLQKVFNLLRENFFSPSHQGLFRPIYESLSHQDAYLLCADFDAYSKCQERVSEEFKNKKVWTKKSILNVARMGKFSSDRTILEYAKEIWNVKPTNIKKANLIYEIK